jgi:hypothetical protein
MEPEPQKKRRAGPGRGVDKWTPTKKQRETAKVMFACGATQDQVGLQLGVSRDRIARHLATEFEHGRELAKLNLGGKLYRKAMGNGDTACLIFLAKNWLGMTDKPWWMMPGALPPHPNDTPHEGREELCVSVSYRWSSDPQALPPPPPDRLPQSTVEATASKVG